MKNLQNQLTILLIENDSDWLADVYAVLQKAGYDVLTAKGGDEGFCVARRVRPDLILCEAALPDISGVQLCYMIRADKNLSAVSFVLIGELCQGGDAAVEAFRAGADDYLASDCERQFLQSKIARLLELQAVEADLRRRCRNLRRSERHLAKIIEDASNLVTVLDPASEFIRVDEYDASPPKSFFGKKAESKKNVDALESWKRLMQPVESVRTNDFIIEEREKIYYEIIG